MSTKIQFLGAAETVTGSRYLITTDSARVLVDCGLFQGFKKLRQRNWETVPFRPSSLDAVLLTHAHIDHSGYLPRLCKQGFSGPVHCTEGSRDLLKILLPDCAYLQEEDARRANKYGYTRHSPAEPLYTRQDAETALKQLNPHPYSKAIQVAKGIRATFTRAGHIVGSSCLRLTIDGTIVTFTGDVGRPVDPIMKPAELLGATDYLITESTYGDRRHPSQNIADELGQVIRETATMGGVIVVPAFAVGRAQHLLHILAQLKHEGKIPALPVYLDSPMAIKATRVFERNTGEHRLTPVECEQMGAGVAYAETPNESKAIAAQEGSRIIISASGMATGGRVLHHLRQYLPDKKNTILFVGYQAGGTRGRTLVDGTDELKIHGQYVPVRARIAQVQGLSAHADYREMIDWFSASKISPRRVFVTHGEPNASDAFRRRLRDEMQWDVVVPDDASEWTLD